MENFYTVEKNAQILISLMKAHEVKKVVISPGATNICVVQSLQCDPYFEIYSSVDERSAAYIACGLAEESGEPVALSCTGATASRNYVPGLTEAFYRKLPILAITSTLPIGRISNHFPQVIDRTSPMKDIAKFSVTIPTIHDSEDAWSCNIELNKALLELRRNGGGPVHINLTTNYNKLFNIKKLPETRVIRRVFMNSEFPVIRSNNIAIFIGAHSKMNAEMCSVLDEFCEKYNAIVTGDNTSGYKGKYWCNMSFITSQDQYISPFKTFDLLIHLGEVSGSYLQISPKSVWRVNPDGEIRDTFKTLTKVFEMEEETFFRYYVNEVENKKENTLVKEINAEYERLYNKIPELPLSNPWIAKNTINKLPENSVIHFGILNSLRSWNYFNLPKTVYGYSNTGGFGIDGCVSSLLGASLANSNKLYFGVVGDLAFFYDMNSLGNRHFPKNIRLMVVNNGCGTEFKIYNHNAAVLGNDADAYTAAVGHYGQQSPKLLKHYAEDLGFTYISASSKEEYLKNVDFFVSPEMYDRPVIFEVFTDSQDESDAISLINNLEVSAKGIALDLAKKSLGPQSKNIIKKILGK